MSEEDAMAMCAGSAASPVPSHAEHERDGRPVGECPACGGWITTCDGLIDVHLVEVPMTS